MDRDNISIQTIIGVIFVIAALAIVPAVISVLTESVDNQVTTKSLVEEASYIIYRDDGYTCAKNGTTGRIESRSENSTTVIQSAINSTVAGSIVITDGEYEISDEIYLHDNISLVGSGNPTITYILDAGTMLSTPERFGPVTTLSASAKNGAESITVSDGSQYSAGDFIKIISNRTIASLYNRAEINQIKNIVGNVLTLTRPVDDDYLTTDPSYVRSILFTDGVELSGIVFNGSGTGKNTTMLDGHNIKGLHIDNCLIQNWGNTAVRIIDGVFATIENSIFQNNFLAGYGYSIGIVDASEKIKIENNVFRYYGRHYIATGTSTPVSGSPYVGGMYRDLVISGNSFESTSTGEEAINNHEGAYGQMTITGNTFRGCKIAIDTINSYATITNNYFQNCPIGVVVANGKEIRQSLISGNTFVNSNVGTQKAILVNNDNVTISFNHFTNALIVLNPGVSNNTNIVGNSFINNTASNSIEAVGTSAARIINLVISGNSLENCGSTNAQYAIKMVYVDNLEITDNHLSRSGRLTVTNCRNVNVHGNFITLSAYTGMEFTSVQNATINGNSIYSGTFRSITVVSAAYATTQVMISDNYIVSAHATRIYQDGSYTNFRVLNNAGWVTEASGVATILNGQSYITVTHGLSATPTKVIVTSGTGGTYTLYVTTLGATTFRIYADSAVSGNQTVYWYAVV